MRRADELAYMSKDYEGITRSNQGFCFWPITMAKSLYVTGRNVKHITLVQQCATDLKCAFSLLLQYIRMCTQVEFLTKMGEFIN